MLRRLSARSPAPRFAAETVGYKDVEGQPPHVYKTPETNKPTRIEWAYHGEHF